MCAGAGSLPGPRDAVDVMGRVWVSNNPPVHPSSQQPATHSGFIIHEMPAGCLS